MKQHEIKPNMPVYNVAEKYSGVICGRTDDPETWEIKSKRGRYKWAKADVLREISSPDAVLTDIDPKRFAELRGVARDIITRKIRSGQLFPGMVEVRKFGRNYVITVDEKLIKKANTLNAKK